MVNGSLQTAQLAHRSYTDLNSLQSIRQQGQTEAIEEVARQFESIYLQMMLKSMRDANGVFAEGNFLNSNEMQFRQDMLDKQLSLTLTEGQGVGLAEVIVKQLSRQAGEPADKDGKETSARMSIQDYRAHPVSVNNTANYIGLSSVQTSREPNQDPDIQTPQQFVEALWPLAKKVGEMLGVDPKAILAQSALETGWGNSISRDGDKNFFGIKSDKAWQGDSVSRKTLEFRSGLMQSERAQFRAYGSYADSFADYANFLQENPRYESALEVGLDPHQYARKLQDAGYATDPHYAKKISNIVDSELLQSALGASDDSSHGLMAGEG